MPTADYTDLSRETVLWNHPELITPGDLNTQQRLGERRMSDYLARSLLLSAGDFDSAGPFDPWLRPVAGALAVEGTDPATMSMIVRPGAIFWRSGADPGGVEPHWLLHQLAQSITVALDPADPTNPRHDTVSAKVERDPLDVNSADGETRVIKNASGIVSSTKYDKRRRTLLTVTYTPGAPAPSPSAPAAPAGQVKIAEVRVPNAVSSVSAETVADYRTPAGVTRFACFASEFVRTTFAGSPATFSDIIASANGQTAHWHINPSCSFGVEGQRSGALFNEIFSPRHLRLRRIAINMNPTGSSTIALLTANGNLVETLSNTIDAQNWAHDTPSFPTWIDIRAWPSSGIGSSPLAWRANTSGHPATGGGLVLRATSAATGNSVGGVIADFWGV